MFPNAFGLDREHPPCWATACHTYRLSSQSISLDIGSDDAPARGVPGGPAFVEPNGCPQGSLVASAGKERVCFLNLHSWPTQPRIGRVAYSGHPWKSSAMLAATRAADALTDSRARCA